MAVRVTEAQLSLMGERVSEALKRDAKSADKPRKVKRSIGEEWFKIHVTGYNLPEPVREFRFDPVRMWRFDFAWPTYQGRTLLVALEVEGGVFMGKDGRGAHATGEAITRDCEKSNAAQLQGWLMIRATTAMVKSGEAARLVKQALQLRGVEFGKTDSAPF